jgi:hypothetical protein
MIYTDVLNRSGRGVRSPADTLTEGLSPSQLGYNGAKLIGISRHVCAVDMVDKPMKSDKNRAMLSGPTGA